MLLGCMGFMMATFYLVPWVTDGIRMNKNLRGVFFPSTKICHKRKFGIRVRRDFSPFDFPGNNLRWAKSGGLFFGRYEKF